VCRKAFRVLVLAILSVFIATTAVAQPIVIEDFESYQWPSPPLYPWQDISPGPSSAELTILNGDAPQGGWAGQFDYHIAGGWQYPDDPTNYEPWDNAGMQRQFEPLDFQPGGEIHMHVKLEPGWDISKVDEFIIGYAGDQFGQTWLPGPAIAEGAVFWLDPATIPAIIAPDNWIPPWPPGTDEHWYDIPIISPDDGWVEIVIDENMWMNWGAPLADFDAMSSISLQLWGSGPLPEYPPIEDIKLDGTNNIWPSWPLNGSIDIDYIYYVPEPATIALLAFGGLAVIRSKQSRKSS